MNPSLGGLRVGFLGGGHMGRALADALLKAGLPASQLWIAESAPEVRRALQQSLGVEVVNSGAQLPPDLEVLILAVKPQDLAAALAPIVPMLAAKPMLVVSIAAGVTLDTLRALCGAQAALVRAMPNRPASIGVGATALFASEETSPADRALATQLLAAAGAVVWVEAEALMDVVTALSGSGPAYFFLLAEAMVDAAVAQGLPSDTARHLALATLAGSGAMCAEDGVDLATLRASVTSKGGTTAAALEQFQRGDFAGLVSQAMQAAIIRGRELSGKASGGS
jgi:pyrroline-5-carboxylate reductase